VTAPVKVTAPVEVTESVKVTAPVKATPSKQLGVVKPQSTAPTVAWVAKRLDQARTMAASLPNAAPRRMMNLELDRIEARLKSGEAPRALDSDLGEVVEKYGVP
jgi:hypothetical protein